MTQNMKMFLIFVIGIYFSIPCFAQTLPAWINLYPFDSHDYGTHESNYKVGKDGSSIFLGYTETDNPETYLAYLIKYRPDGNIWWSQTIAGLGAYAKMKVDDSLNAYVCGRIFDSIAGYNIFLTKYYSDGTLAWNFIYDGGSGNDEPFDFSIDKDHNVFLTGYTYDSQSNNDILIIEINASGNLAWATSYDHAFDYSETGKSISTDQIGNIYVTGFSRDTTLGNFVVLKLNSDGNIVWERRFQTNYFGEGDWIQTFQNEFVYVSGIYSAPGFSKTFIAKLDSSGNMIWSEIYYFNNLQSDQGWDTRTGIDVNNNGDVIFTGIYSSEGEFHHCTIVKLNSEGVIQFERSYDTDLGVAYAEDFSCDSNGNIFLLSELKDSSYSSSKVLVVKYDSSGNILNDFDYASSLSSQYDLGEIGLDQSSDIFVGGIELQSNITGFWVAKFGALLDGTANVFSTQQEAVLVPSLASNFIRFDIPNAKSDIVSIFNILGDEMIQEKVSGQTARIDISELPPGLYIVKDELQLLGKFVKQ